MGVRCLGNSTVTTDTPIHHLLSRNRCYIHIKQVYMSLDSVTV